MRVKNNTFIKSILMLFVALMLYRIGSHTPIPFINKEVFSSIFEKNTDGLLAMYNVMNGGSLSRMSIFTLGIMPYISASIVIFMFQLFSDKVKELSNQEAGKIKIEQIKRGLTIGIVLFQSFALSTVLQSQVVNGEPLATISGFPFYVTTFLSLLAGTFSVVWLANTMTFIGFGSGVSLVIMFGILSSMPTNFITISTMYENGTLSLMSMLSLICMVFVGFILVIVFENTERRIPVLKPDRLTGVKRSFLPFKANPVGIMPPIFAAICLSMPVSMLQMLGENAPAFLLKVKSIISHGSIGYAVFYAVLVFVFGLAMTQVINNPDKIATSLNAQNTLIPSIKPGSNTSKYLKKLIFSLTIIGCIYLVVLCSIPEFINFYMGIPLYLGGTSILIMVSTTSEMKKSIFGMLEQNNYKELENKILD